MGAIGTTLFAVPGCYTPKGGHPPGGDTGSAALDPADMGAVTGALLCILESECATTDCAFDTCLDEATAAAGPTVDSPMYAAELGAGLASEFQALAIEQSEFALAAVGIASVTKGEYTVTGRVEPDGDGYTYTAEPSDRLEWVDAAGVTSTITILDIDAATLENAADEEYDRPSLLAASIYTPDVRDIIVEVQQGDTMVTGTQAVELGEEGRTAYFAGQIQQIENSYDYSSTTGGTIKERDTDLRGFIVASDFIQNVNENHDDYLGIVGYTLLNNIDTYDNNWQMSDRTEFELSATIKTEVNNGAITSDIWEGSSGTLKQDGADYGTVRFELFGNVPRIVLDAPFGQVVLRVHLG
jgi:hypothetical protein